MADLSADEKLVALGLKTPSSQTNPYRDLFQQIRDAVSYSTFVTDVNGLADFPAFESYLQTTIGMTAAEASRFRTLVEQKYGTMTAFQTALGEASSYDEWEADFKFGETFGMTPSDEDPTNAGIRVHSEPGVSFDGVGVPKGTVEVYGPRVEFSQTQAYDLTVPDFSYTNITVSNTEPWVNEIVDISVDVTNNNGYSMSPIIRLLEDGEVVDSTQLSFGGNETIPVTFQRSWSELVSVDLRVEASPSVTVNVTPRGIR